MRTLRHASGFGSAGLARRARGLTLLEVLVAVAIVAVLAAAVSVGLSGLGGARETGHEAQRLQARLDYACETAELDGRAIGFQADDGTYRFLSRNGDVWTPITQPAALAGYRLPGEMRLSVYRDGHLLKPADTADAQTVPPVVCFASGESTPFTIHLDAGADNRYVIEGRGDGTTHLVRRNAID